VTRLIAGRLPGFGVVTHTGRGTRRRYRTPLLQEIDFRSDVRELDVPVYLLDGENELRGRRELALEWFEQLSAPHKELITYADAGHAVAFEQADAFLRLMNEEVVPSTYGAQKGDQP
jgi:pimeloyl-ACP methyl ester carboxylesterase